MARVACLLAFLLSPTTFADELGGQPPKDQQEVADKITALAELNQAANRETNGLRKKELQDKVRADHRAVVELLNKKIRTEGLAGWVGKCNGVGASTVTFTIPGPAIPQLLIAANFANADEKAKEVLRSLEKGDLVQFTVAPNPRIGVRVRSEKDLMPDMGITTDGKGLKELKKLGGK